MDLSIIIVNWNGGELLLRCLESIRAQSTNLPSKVIVIDNDSRDGSRQAANASFPQFTIINSGANLGFARANNLARPLIDSQFVLFLNPDTELLPGTLEQAVQFLRESPEVGALGCKMRYPDGNIQEQGWQYFPTPLSEFLELLFVSSRTRTRLKRWLPYLDPNRSGYVKKLYGGCLFCRKSVLDEVGWFDERFFMYAEDVDLSRALLDRGWKLYYLSSAEVLHVTGASSQKASGSFSILMKAESVAKLIQKRHGPFAALRYRFGTFAGSAVRILALCLVWASSSVRLTSGRFPLSTGFFKYRLLLLWSLGLKKAVIPS